MVLRRSRILGSLGCLVVLLLGAAALADELTLSPEQRELLTAGQVLVLPQPSPPEGGVAIRGLAVVDAPPAQVWPVVRDCQHFDEFMPRMRESVLLEREGKISVCRIRVDMPFPFQDIVSESRSVERDLPAGGFVRRWSQIRGDYKRSEGSWSVLPWGEDATRSLVIYQQELQPRFAVPDMMLRIGQKRTLPDTFRAIRQRVGPAAVAAGKP